MRILYLSHYALPHLGGIEVAVDALSREMLARGHEVTHVASDAGGPGERRPGPEVIVRVPAANTLEDRLGVPLPLFAPHRLRSVLRREVERADVVHAHGFLYASSSLGLRLASRTGRAGVLTEHVGHVPYDSSLLDGAERAAIATLGRRTARAARAIIVLNDKVRAEMARLAPGAELLTIPNGVDLDAYRPPAEGEREALREELGWDERPRILFVGRLVAKKGADLAVEAAGKSPGLELLLVGRGKPPAGLPHNVRVMGELPPDEVARLYRAADALLLPSRGEGFPLTVQEAMASGLPVVLLDEPVYAPYLEGSGEAARLTAPEPEAIAAALAELTGDADARLRAGRDARAHAERRFSWVRSADEHERLYRSFL